MADVDPAAKEVSEKLLDKLLDLVNSPDADNEVVGQKIDDACRVLDSWDHTTGQAHR